MTKLIPRPGRPSLPGHDIALKLSALSVNHLNEGATLLSQLNGKAASKAAWFRLLLSNLGETPPSRLITAEVLREGWPADTEIAVGSWVTVRIEEAQRVWLRQWECFVQSLDWTRELYRNETASLLVEMQGPALNSMLNLQIEAQKKRAD